MKYKCKTCNKTRQEDDLPYQWASIHQESSGVHDSACVTYKDDYFLCPDCRPEALNVQVIELMEALKRIAKGEANQVCNDGISRMSSLTYMQLTQTAIEALAEHGGGK